MTTPATMPSTYDEGGPMITLRRQLERRAEEFRMVLPDHISPAKFQRTLLTAVQTNPDLLACDRRSFLTSCMKAAQDGLLPDGREAAIVPFKSRVKDPERGWVEVRLAQYLPMVFGLRKKILQSGEIADLFAAVVYRQEIERGLFVYEEGSERTLRHRPILDPDFAPTDADIALAYSVATFADGFKSFEVMRRGELDRVREASQTGSRFDAKGEPRESKGPWRDWFPEMAKKTVIRRHAKTLPQSGDIIVRDIEAEDMGLAAAKSTLALLDSRQSEPPRQLLGEEPDHPEVDPFEPFAVEPKPEPKPDTEPDKKPVETAEPPPETSAAEADTYPDAEPDEADFEPEPEPEPETDELGVTRDDPKSIAESYIARSRNCELLVDLKALEREAQMDLAQIEAADPMQAAAVDIAFANARKRLTPPAKTKAS